MERYSADSENIRYSSDVRTSAERELLYVVPFTWIFDSGSYSYLSRA
jgi:hypothetical protein